jgi:hypothetical protein
MDECIIACIHSCGFAVPSKTAGECRQEALVLALPLGISRPLVGLISTQHQGAKTCANMSANLDATRAFLGQLFDFEG